MSTDELTDGLTRRETIPAPRPAEPDSAVVPKQPIEYDPEALEPTIVLGRE
ncbi:hypothetical protein [Amycolatopsis nigrescens]|uniref:hypothetical protein n=1 Tax=Amycolatopsis nigrescens TaxID=381445 RepID=UPI0003615D04|nr:hypothetical protein [Amycolatopsis nigrescens]